MARSKSPTQAEYVKSFKHQLGMYGVQKAFIDHINNEWKIDGTYEKTKKIRIKIMEIVSKHLKKYCPTLNYSSNWNGYVFTNNIGLSLENGLISMSKLMDYGSYKLVVEGEEIMDLNFSSDSETFELSKTRLETWAKSRGYY